MIMGPRLRLNPYRTLLLVVHTHLLLGVLVPVCIFKFKANIFCGDMTTSLHEKEKVYLLIVP